MREAREYPAGLQGIGCVLLIRDHAPYPRISRVTGRLRPAQIAHAEISALTEPPSAGTMDGSLPCHSFWQSFRRGELPQSAEGQEWSPQKPRLARRLGSRRVSLAATVSDG